jgi:hypothetical protein
LTKFAKTLIEEICYSNRNKHKLTRNRFKKGVHLRRKSIVPPKDNIFINPKGNTDLLLILQAIKALTVQPMIRIGRNNSVRLLDTILKIKSTSTGTKNRSKRVTSYD